MKLTLVKGDNNRIVQRDFDNYIEVCHALNVWPQQVRVSLNSHEKLNGYYVVPTNSFLKGENRVKSKRCTLINKRKC